MRTISFCYLEKIIKHNPFYYSTDSRVVSFDEGSIPFNLSVFLIPDKTATKNPIEAHSGIVISQASAYPIDKALMLSLFAFDRPAFDEYTPAYISAIDGKEGEIFIEDTRSSDNEAFALERADRLGSLYGVTVHPIPPSDPEKSSDTELYRIEKKLTDKACELLSSDSKIKSLFGTDIYRRITKTSSVRQRIRSLGMLIQSELWLCHYPIIII